MSAAIKRKFRAAPRRELGSLSLDSFASLEDLEKLASFGLLIEASITGLLIRFKREDFIKKELRTQLNIDSLKGQKVYFRIHEMDLEISGIVRRTEFQGKKGFLVAVDYSHDAPEYWRECLMDLLPVSDSDEK
jgi:hypothetical protein